MWEYSYFLKCFSIDGEKKHIVDTLILNRTYTKEILIRQLLTHVLQQTQKNVPFPNTQIKRNINKYSKKKQDTTGSLQHEQKTVSSFIFTSYTLCTNFFYYRQIITLNFIGLPVGCKKHFFSPFSFASRSLHTQFAKGTTRVTYIYIYIYFVMTEKKWRKLLLKKKKMITVLSASFSLSHVWCSWKTFRH